MAGKASRNVRKSTFTGKSKRSKRAHHRPHPERSIVTRSQCNTGVSFHRLPTEVFDKILDKLSVLEISVYSMVSKEINGYVMDYISTLAWKKKMIFGSFHPSTCLEERSIIEHYRDLGLLFKRCTLLLPTKERLKFVFTKVSQIPCFTMDQCLSQDCNGFSIYGVFLQTLIAGWDELECHRVFNYLCDLTNLPQKVEAAVTGKPGERWYHEVQIRLFCRQVLLDPWPNEPESHFWLTQVLRPWPMVSQAHLLFILYGPLLPEGTLGWLDMVESGVPYTALWDLARAINVMVAKPEVNDQCTHSMLTILEELIVIPQPWHIENVARLMVVCGSSFCYHVLASKAVSGRLPEISRLIVYIILVCEKDGFQMSWAVKMVQHILKMFSTGPEKYSFVQQLENTFSQVIREIFESSIPGNQDEDRETFQNLCILLNSIANFHAKFLYMLHI